MDETPGEYRATTAAPGPAPGAEAAEDVATAVDEHELPAELAELADRYAATVGIRDRFVWKWFHLLNPEFKLSAVDREYESKVQDDKTFLTFYITLIDDLLEVRGDHATFEAAAGLPFDGSPSPDEDVDGDYLELTADVWDTVEDRLGAAPAHEAFRPVVDFDLRQVINAIRYSAVVTERPEMGNLTEAYVYGSHNMVMFPYAWIDLMHSSSFEMAELGAVRSMLWHAQRLARIGNWVSTWERELGEEDFGSGILIHALDSGLISTEELRRTAADEHGEGLAEIAERIEAAGIEEYFLDEWRWHFNKVATMDVPESIDLDAFLHGLERVLEFHLGSRGFK